MEEKDRKYFSKFLSFTLRHHPEQIGIELDKNGWVNIDLLLKQAQKHGKNLTKEQLLEIVEKCEKKRFSLSEDGFNIRAAQGHSTNQVAIEFPEALPPQILYHGTAEIYLSNIRHEGLKSRSRHYVHLSLDRETAKKVGSRHGKPIVLEILAQQMVAKNIPFYLSDNGIFLVEYVSPEFIVFPEK